MNGLFRSTGVSTERLAEWYEASGIDPADLHDSSVYFVGNKPSPEYVKIGIARNVHARVQNLQTASPEQLILLTSMPGGKETESVLHSAFAKERVRGEWFRLSGRVHRFLVEVLNAELGYCETEPELWQRDTTDRIPFAKWTSVTTLPFEPLRQLIASRLLNVYTVSGEPHVSWTEVRQILDEAQAFGGTDELIKFHTSRSSVAGQRVMVFPEDDLREAAAAMDRLFAREESG
jgi:hypothetical protein